MPAPKSATGPTGTVQFDSGESFSQWMISEHLISTVPWDDCGSFVRFSVTFISEKGEAGEAEVIAEVERRLTPWKFNF
jgi:LL-diaminopimelate aminotransferase